MSEELNLSCNNINNNDYFLRQISSLSQEELANVDEENRRAMIDLLTTGFSEEILSITAPKVWFESPADFLAKVASDFIFLAVDELKEKYDETINYILSIVNQFGMTSLTDNMLDSISHGDNYCIAPVAECVINEFLALVSIKNMLVAIEKSTPGNINRCILDMLDESKVYAGVAVVAGPGEELNLGSFENIGTLNKLDMCRIVIPLNLGQTGREILTEDEHAHDNIIGLVLMVKRLLADKETEDINTQFISSNKDLEDWNNFVKYLKVQGDSNG